ncbi:MAG: methyltransferase [Azospirillum sp.]|nr:methyltransferase [Azospirillum sp.]
MSDPLQFIRSQTAIGSPPLVPEVRLHLATEITPLWQATEDTLAQAGLPPPYWAFAWAGGQAVARYVLDRPEVVAGLRVLDFAAGNGLIAIAATLAGAASVEAVEVDALAVAAIALNATLNGVSVAARFDDPVGRPLPGIDVVLAGDVCYERPMAVRIIPWLAELAASGVQVVVGDPGRAYLPRHGLEPLARHTVPTSRELEDRDVRETMVWRLTAAAAL